MLKPNDYPKYPDGSSLCSLQITEDPPRYIFGSQADLEWVRDQLLEKKAGPAPNWQPIWK